MTCLCKVEGYINTPRGLPASLRFEHSPVFSHKFRLVDEADRERDKKHYDIQHIFGEKEISLVNRLLVGGKA